MTLYAHASTLLRQKGFTYADIEAIMAILQAAPWSQHMAKWGKWKMDFARASLPNQMNAYLNQVDAIARAYHQTFLQARKNDPRISVTSKR